MKYQYFIAFLSLVGGSVWAPAVAQSTSTGPWAVAPTSPPFCNCGFPFTNTYRLQLPAGAVWAVRYNSGGQGSFTNTILGSADNGQTWQTRAFSGRSSTIPSGASVRDLFALDGQRAWAVLYQYPSGTTQVYQTSTGATGLAIAPSQPAGEVYFLRYFDDRTGVAIIRLPPGATGWPVQRTSDGGLTWVPVTTLPGTVAGIQPLAIAQLGTHLWATLEQGKVLHTPDEGQTWTVATAAQDLTQLTFRDAQNGLATSTANARSLFRTTDGGTTWSPVTATGPRRLTALAAVPGTAGTYLSVGQSVNGEQAGTAVSYNDGQTWQDLGGTVSFDGLAVDPQGQAWASFYSTGFLARYAGSPLASRLAQPAHRALYPNPTTGRVALPQAGGYRQMQVYDTAGRLCLSQPVPAGAVALDLSSLRAGLYQVRLLGGPGEPVQQRLIVAR